MAWTAPRTWVAAENVTAALLNTHLRDNLLALKDPPSANYELNEGADITSNSATFVDVDGTNFSLQITTVGGDVFVHFHGTVFHSAGAGSNKRVFFDVDVNGARTGGDDGIMSVTISSGDPDECAVTFTRLITGLGAGTHTFKLQWKMSAGTQGLYAGAGTGSGDLHPQFWARELS